MIKNLAFWRKVGYLCGIAALFIPISFISAPAASREEGGGVLSKMRREQKLSQAQLGKIDPASASMSLATLGMRGVAANLLWGRAYHFKKTENWDSFKATLNQITKLQPNFVSVWQFQAWNISYNVSVEFDNYQHRYHWVKKGLDYLIEGTEYNEDDPLLLWDAGWFFGHKMGRADEYRQFRRLYRDDADFHAGLPLNLEDVRGPDGKPDNWLSGREWFLRAQRAVDRGAIIKRLSTYYWEGDKKIVDKKDTPLKGKNPLIFHSDPPKASINYADAIEEDGYLDEKGLLAWRNAGREWRAYGDRPIISSYGVKIHLNDRDKVANLVTESLQKFNELLPEARERLLEQRIADLTDEERAAVNTNPSERTEEQRDLVFKVTREKLTVKHSDVARLAPPELREEAMRLARLVEENEDQVRIIDRYRDIVNFVYWDTRCQAEQQPITISARKRVLEAKEAFDEADLEGAKQRYEEAWDLWAQVFEEYPLLLDDVEGEDVMETVMDYKNLLGQLDEPFPPPGFKLINLVKAHAGDYDIVGDDPVIQQIAEGTPADIETVESPNTKEENLNGSLDEGADAAPDTESEEEVNVDPSLTNDNPAPSDNQETAEESSDELESDEPSEEVEGAGDAAQRR